MRDLVRRFDAIEFSQLLDSYDVMVTEIPGAHIEFQRDGKSYRVSVRGAEYAARPSTGIVVRDDSLDANEVISYADEGYHARQRAKYGGTFVALDDLATAIDTAAGTARWIGSAPERK